LVGARVQFLIVSMKVNFGNFATSMLLSIPWREYNQSQSTVDLWEGHKPNLIPFYKNLERSVHHEGNINGVVC